MQKYGKDVYLRASEAQQCRVHSTLVIPLFADAARAAAVGALEVVQTCDDMPFSAVVKALAAVLEVCSTLGFKGLGFVSLKGEGARGRAVEVRAAPRPQRLGSPRAFCIPEGAPHLLV